jgi:hypothetical protein
MYLLSGRDSCSTTGSTPGLYLLNFKSGVFGDLACIFTCNFLNIACVLLHVFFISLQLKKLGAEVIAKEREVGLSDSAKNLLDRKLKKVQDGARDVYL